MKPQQLNVKISELYDKLKQVRIIPAGANDPLPVVPEEVEIDESDLDLASDAWNESMPDYAGLLDAEVINKQNV